MVRPSAHTHFNSFTNDLIDLEWKLIYVSSPGRLELDQELDDCMVGPVPVGINSFEFESPAPIPSKIPLEDVLGVAAIILTASYKDQEFVRVGYYQNTEYDNDEMKEHPPAVPMFERLTRELITKPKVTRFQVKWYVLFARLAHDAKMSGDRDDAPATGVVPVFGGAPGSEFPRPGSGQILTETSGFASNGEGFNYAASSSAVPPVAASNAMQM